MNVLGKERIPKIAKLGIFSFLQVSYFLVFLKLFLGFGVLLHSVSAIPWMLNEDTFSGKILFLFTKKVYALNASV